MKIGLKWGVLFGVAVCVWTIILHLLGWYTVDLKQGQRADIAATILPIVAIGMAIRERRRANPGHTLTIGQGMATGLVVGLVSVPITAGFLWIYHHQINPLWLEHLVDYERAKMVAAAASPAALVERLAAVRNGGRDVVQVSGAVIGTSLISVVLSFLFSLVLRRSPEKH